jgi:valyl-tRNA synthetase
MWEGRIAAGTSGDTAGQGSQGAGHAGQDADFAVQWFGNRLSEVRAELDQLFAEYRVSEALKTLYSLIWDDFCSWYLEWVKPGYEQPIDGGVYRMTVRYFEELVHLLHPFMPFITEELYHLLADQADDLCIRQYAPAGAAVRAVLDEGSLLKEAITSLRDARNKAQLKQKDRVSLHIQSASEETYRRILPILARQVNADPVGFTSDAIPGTLAVVSGKDKFYIGAEQKIDTGNQKQELLKELEYLRGFLASVTKKLSNDRFVQNARPEVVNMEVKKKEDAETKIRVLEESLAGL